MRFRVIFALGAMILLGGCLGPTQQPIPVSGSKADATVLIAAEFPENGAPIDWSTAQPQAEQKCAVWGYTGA